MTSERFLVPTDFSPDANGALRYAICCSVGWRSEWGGRSPVRC